MHLWHLLLNLLLILPVLIKQIFYEGDGYNMKDIKKLINWYGAGCLASLCLAYIFYPERRLNWIPFPPNNFCFTIISGIFTGFAVAFLSEILTYFKNKSNVRAAIYANAVEFYKLSVYQKAYLEYYLNNSYKHVPSNIGKMSKMLIENYLSNITMIDYSVYKTKGILYVALNNFRTKIMDINKTLKNLGEIEIIYNKCLIETYKTNRDHFVTTEYPQMNQIMTNTCKLLDTIISESEKLCSAFENDNNFNWKEVKNNIDDTAKEIVKNRLYDPYEGLGI